MKYERFEDLPVWRMAADLAADMFEWTSDAAFQRKGDLANQLQRSALSVSNNIAEGFERGTTSELITFLYYARGSAGEVRSMLRVMQRVMQRKGGFRNMADRVQQVSETCVSISRQIRAWTNQLQNSDITGQRYLNDKSRQSYKSKQRRAAYVEQRRVWQAEFQKKLELKAIESRNPRDDADDKQENGRQQVRGTEGE